MPTLENLKNILEQQKKVTESLENELSNIDLLTLTSEIDNLKQKLSEYETNLSQQSDLNSKLSEENKSLKASLYEQIYNEKISILKAANKKVDIYFKSKSENELSQLRSFELTCKGQIDEMANILKKNKVSAENELYTKLNELRQLLDLKVSCIKEEHAENSGSFSKNQNAEFQKLYEENISENDVKKILKKNNLESFVGLNILNKIGILFIIIGVIATSQFTYFKLPDILKSIFSFSLGGIMLVCGEFFNRKKQSIFSIGIISGGIGVLYASLALSFFRLNTLSMYPALGLCIAITVVAFLLSIRYDAQVIVAFSLIGGYLPIFSISRSIGLVYSAMLYFVILNIFALIISSQRKWLFSTFIGFILNVVGTSYIVAIMLFERSVHDAFGMKDFITIMYIIFSFVIYTLIPISSTFFKSIKFKTYDVVLLSLNTFISSLIMYLVFYQMNLLNYTGLLALVFAIIYISLGKFIEIRISSEKLVTSLFYLTGLTFVVLVIPFQFGKVWLSLGWLIEGTALVIYGILKRNKNFQKAGFAICTLCLYSFIILDVLLNTSYLFAYKYFSITLASILILSAFTYKKTLSFTGVRFFKYFTTINLWIFMIYIISSKVSNLLLKYSIESPFNYKYLTLALLIAVSFLLAYLIPRIRILSDMPMKVISIIIYGVTILILLSSNLTSPLVEGFSESSMWVIFIASMILVVINILSILALKDLILFLVVERKLGVEWYPLILSAYFVLLLTQNLISQYNLEFTNALISIIYILTAFSWIVFGFIKRYAFIRIFGLGLSILAIAKLFILDFGFLTLEYRIISYFAFGITLLAISFVYQYFSKRIDSIGVNIKYVEKSND